MSYVPLIRFERDGKDVVAKVNTDLPHEKGGTVYYPLRWTCTSAAEAELLTRYLENRMDKIIEGVRRDAYRQGWKDKAEKKRGRATTFSLYFGEAVDGGCW